MSNYNGQFQDSSANVLLGTPHSYANIEGATSSQAYIKGQMIVFNNRLCEVTATIAQGDTLTIGTNIAYKNVGDIGKQLVASDGTGFYFDVKDGEYGYYPSASKTASEFVPFGGTLGDCNISCSVVHRVWEYYVENKYIDTTCTFTIQIRDGVGTVTNINNSRTSGYGLFGVELGRYHSYVYNFRILSITPV